MKPRAVADRSGFLSKYHRAACVSAKEAITERPRRSRETSPCGFHRSPPRRGLAHTAQADHKPIFWVLVLASRSRPELVPEPDGHSQRRSRLVREPWLSTCFQ